MLDSRPEGGTGRRCEAVEGGLSRGCPRSECQTHSSGPKNPCPRLRTILRSAHNLSAPLARVGISFGAPPPVTPALVEADGSFNGHLDLAQRLWLAHQDLPLRDLRS
jgi:hypothetical protein